MGTVNVSSCRCFMFVLCVHHVAVLNAAFCMTFSLCNAGRGCKRPYENKSHDCLVGSHEPVCPMLLWQVFLLFVEICVCVLICCECVLYVSIGSKIRPRTFGCVAMGSAVLFILRFRFRRVWSEQSASCFVWI